MPFESKAQQRFMFAKHPEMAKEWADKTPDISALPEHVKKMAAGGDVTAGSPATIDSAGMPDASASDFLAPFLLGPAAKGMAEELPAALEGLGETGEITIGRAAPKMEEAAESATPKVEAFIKGVQKSPNGNEVKIWGVRGDPSEISKLGYGSDPASVPENILREKGVLPTTVDATNQLSPTGYAKGGKVERSSLAHPTPNGMMARPMADGGFPHVTFMENQTPEENAKTTHLEKGPAKMAEGGTIHKAEDRNKEPAKPKDVDMSHEKKLNSIYKAMGIKKYADGGVATSDNTVDPSQLPTPTPSDPNYWDQIKAALAQVASPVTGAANAITGPVQNAVAAATPAIQSAAPAAISAVNNLTGMSLPVPAAPTPAGTPAMPAAPTGPLNPMDENNLRNTGTAATDPNFMAKLAAGTAMTPAGTPGGAPSALPGAMPNLSTIFNQDTSKLTAGVNPEDRQALANKLQSQQHGIGAIIAQAVSGLGDALAAKGGKEQHSLQNIFSMQKTQRDEALANFDAARQDRLQKLALQTTMGDNALKQAAAADAYGTDEHLNSMIGAPKGTMKKDLPTYFSLMSSKVAQQEKDADLYMKAHAQAATDVDNAVKNASVLSIKPSSAQLQASGAKLADQYFNRAKGNILVKPSDGGPAQWIPAQNIGKAKQIDPNLQIQQ